MDTTAIDYLNTSQVNMHLALQILSLVKLNYDDETERINLLESQHNLTYDDYQHRKKILQQRVEDLDENLVELTSFKIGCLRNLSLLDERAINLQNENDDINKTLTNCELSVAKLKKDFEKTSQSLDEKRRKCSEMEANYKKEVERLNTSLSAQVNNATSLQERLSSSIKENTNLTAELTSTQIKLSEKENISHSDEEKLNTTLLSLQRAERNHQRYRKSFSDCQTESTRLKEELDDEQEELATEKRKHQTCNGNLKKKTKEVNDLENYVRDLEDTIEDMGKYKKQFQEGIEQLDDIVLQNWKFLSQVKTMTCANCNFELALGDIKVTKEMALLAAVRKGDLEVAKQLVNYRTDLTVKSSNGYTLLHWAAAKGQDSITEFLLENGAPLIARSTLEEYTPLHIAAAEGWAKICGRLLRKSAPVNSADKYGRTPLHWAAYNNHLDVVKILLQSRADKNKRDVYENTPLDLASDTDIQNELSK